MVDSERGRQEGVQAGAESRSRISRGTHDWRHLVVMVVVVVPPSRSKFLLSAVFHSSLLSCLFHLLCRLSVWREGGEGKEALDPISCW